MTNQGKASISISTNIDEQRNQNKSNINCYQRETLAVISYILLSVGGRILERLEDD